MNTFRKLLRTPLSLSLWERNRPRAERCRVRPRFSTRVHPPSNLPIRTLPPSSSARRRLHTKRQSSSRTITTTTFPRSSSKMSSTRLSARRITGPLEVPYQDILPRKIVASRWFSRIQSSSPEQRTGPLLTSSPVHQLLTREPVVYLIRNCTKGK